MKYTEAKVVAEIGAVHVGSVERAKKLIKLAVLCGAHYAKFQKRNPEECLRPEIKEQPHPNSIFSYGDTYLEHRNNLELTIQQHQELKECCDEHGIRYASSVWDMTSAREIITLKPDYIKLPSACNTDYDLLKLLTNEFGGDIHISTGMTDKGERIDLYERLANLNLENRCVIYHCTSEYPCSFERLYLLELEGLEFTPTKAVGFSNHGYGIAADIAAYMLGARWIERHFVDDRTFPHTDASASLEPDGLRRLCRDLKMVRKSLEHKKEMSKEEMSQRLKLRKSDD